MTKGKSNTGRQNSRSTSSKRKTDGRSTSGTKRGRQSRPQRPQIDFSALWQPEVWGILLLAVALLTLLSFMSPNQGPVIGGWLRLLRQGFGWGAFLAPAAFGSVGLALLLQGFGRLPPIGGEKVVGGILLLLTALGLTHLIATPPDMPDPWLLVVEGRAGGLLGYLIGEGMIYTVGRIGAYVTIIAFLCIALVLTVGISPVQVGVVLWHWWERLSTRIPLLQAGRRADAADRPPYTINGRVASPATPSRVQEPLPTVQGKPIPAQPTRVEVAPPPPQPEAEPEPEAEMLSPSRPLSPKSGVQWKLPQLSAVLDDLSDQEISEAEIANRVQIIERTLESFGVPARVVEVNQGPVITQFGVEPGFVTGRGGKQTKVKVSRIAALADDLSLALAAAPIRIEAPVPGRSIVGIEVPNKEVALVSLRGVMETEAFKKMAQKTPLPIALGEDVSGEAVVADLVAMPHLLIAGATGSGKSVCINAIIAGFLCTNTPDQLQLIMIDPKRVELTGYNGIPHLLAPVVVDLEKVVGTLKWVTREMDRRYKLFAKVGARNIVDYNKRAMAGQPDKLPYIVVIIDELADMMMVAPEDVERLICRIAQMARATGIHLIIATQRPSVDVVTGLIKANFPARVSFMVTSSVDSRVIIDTVGAERLLGQGDMLFMSPSSSQVMRLQGCLVTSEELNRLITYWKDAARQNGQLKPSPREQFVQSPLPTLLEMQEESEEDLLPGQEDEMIARAAEVVRQEGRASTTLLQRRLRIGYARASRLIDALEKQGVIGPDMGGSRGREVFRDS